MIVLVDPGDYETTLADLRAEGVPLERRRALAAKVFAHTAAYDAAITGYFSRGAEDLPERLALVLDRAQALRYGENPHQRAALYVADEPGLRDLHQLHGKELSFNNLLDVDAAVDRRAPVEQADRLRHHQAHHAVRHRPRRRPRPRPTSGRSRPTGRRPSAR